MFTKTLIGNTFFVVLHIVTMVTGSLDEGTVSLMEKPRCGDKDEVSVISDKKSLITKTSVGT